jgi:hypothetical protein
MLKKTVLCVSILALAGIGAAVAQQPPAGIKRTPLQTIPFPPSTKSTAAWAKNIWGRPPKSPGQQA